MTTLEQEARHLWRLARDLRAAAAQRDHTALVEALDELEVVIMHSDNASIRERAQATIFSTLPGMPAVTIEADGRLCLTFT